MRANDWSFKSTVEYLTSEESIDEFIDQQYNFDYDPNRVITRVINVETRTVR